MTTGDIDKLVKDFCRLDARDFSSLEDYQEVCEGLMLFLRSSGVAPGDRFACWVVINGLRRSKSRKCHAKFSKEMARGALDFDTLMAGLKAVVVKRGRAKFDCGRPHKSDLLPCVFCDKEMAWADVIEGESAGSGLRG